MKKIAIIPARYASTRFPGKPIARICDKPMIQWVYETVKGTKLIDDIFVATDDERIYNCVKQFNGNVVMTSEKHLSGSDRLAECANKLGLNDEDIVLNIQGDEPLIQVKMIEQLLSLFKEEVYMATLRKKINSQDELNDSNVVKVVADINMYAIYFSRFPIPFNRGDKDINYYKHIGIYGYKKYFLDKFTHLPCTSLEMAESLEQLRVLEHGYKIKIADTNCSTIGVDTIEQLRQVESIIKQG